jgi:glutamyl-tRNA synthetase
MKTYYKYAEELIKKKAAYVCSCENEKFKELVLKSKPCPCRALSVKENLERWKKMFDKKGFKEGEAVLRFKSNLNEPNPAMRDFPLARINETKHPRQGNKHRVWPLMNLAVTVDDIETGITHVIRAKEHRDNAVRQEMMMKVLGKKAPVAYFLGRYNFTDLEVSCSKTKEKIKQGLYSGWDDIRLPFIAALRKRGFKPGAFEKMALQRGISEVDKVMAQEDYFRLLDNANREVIGKEFTRASFEKQNKKAKDSIEILMPDAKIVYGKSDLKVSKLKDGGIVYFAGVGYCCFNAKEKIRFWFGHR